MIRRMVTGSRVVEKLSVAPIDVASHATWLARLPMRISVGIDVIGDSHYGSPPLVRYGGIRSTKAAGPLHRFT